MMQYEMQERMHRAQGGVSRGRRGGGGQVEGKKREFMD